MVVAVPPSRAARTAAIEKPFAFIDPLAATTTATTAMNAEITRPVVSEVRPFGPIPSRSTRRAVAVCPTTAPTANRATPTIATAKLAQAMKGRSIGQKFDFQGESFTITDIDNYFDQKK